jgi:hypothetical protein
MLDQLRRYRRYEQKGKREPLYLKVRKKKKPERNEKREGHNHI